MGLGEPPRRTDEQHQRLLACQTVPASLLPLAQGGRERHPHRVPTSPAFPVVRRCLTSVTDVHVSPCARCLEETGLTRDRKLQRRPGNIRRCFHRTGTGGRARARPAQQRRKQMLLEERKVSCSPLSRPPRGHVHVSARANSAPVQNGHEGRR